VLDYESRHEPLLTRVAFLRRLAVSLGAASLLVGVSLLGGMAGYHYLEGEGWTDAFVDAAMILSGMGPMGRLSTNPGKLFAGCYALYSGLALIVATGLIIAPVLHRLFHRFHLDGATEE
jgi:hypothetical protein